MKKKLIAILTLTLIAALLCGTALAYEGDVTIKSAKAYADAKMTQYAGTIPAGTALVVRSYDKYADVYVNGKIYYIDAGTLLKQDISAVYRATLKKGTRVYQQATTGAKSGKVKRSGNVNVCAISGDWALVRTTGSKGLYGFVLIEDLTDIRFK